MIPMPAMIDVSRAEDERKYPELFATMLPMPGKIIVKQDGHAGPRTITRADGSRVQLAVSERFAAKDRPMTGRVLAVGVGKRCELTREEINERVRNLLHGDTSNGFGVVIVDAIRQCLEIERQSRPVSVKAGDRVVFRVFAGDGIEWTDGSMCRCLTEDDILARIE